MPFVFTGVTCIKPILKFAGWSDKHDKYAENKKGANTFSQHCMSLSIKTELEKEWKQEGNNRLRECLRSKGILYIAASTVH